MTDLIEATDRWSCYRRNDLSLREWADGVVVFDEPQGQMHCLAPSAGTALALLMTRPEWTTGDLARQLLGNDEAVSEEELRLVGDVLLQFDALQFIRRLNA